MLENVTHSSHDHRACSPAFADDTRSSSGAKDVVDDRQRARVAALDGAGLSALRALQPLPGPARPQWPARAGPGP